MPVGELGHVRHAEFGSGRRLAGDRRPPRCSAATGLGPDQALPEGPVLLEIAGAAVDQPARARGCAKGQVTASAKVTSATVMPEPTTRGFHGAARGVLGAEFGAAAAGRRSRAGARMPPVDARRAGLEGADLPGSSGRRSPLFGEGIGAIVAPSGGHL